jgi:hypothetical protein
MSNKSIHTLSTLRNQDKNTIPFRIDYIKTLLANKELQPMIDLDNTETDNFNMHINNKINSDDDSNNTYDTRRVLDKKVHDFNNIIGQIGGKLMYVKSGTTGHTFKGIINEDDGESAYAVKVVAYPNKEKYGSINDSRRPENAELMMIKLLSYFVIKRQTPHIVLPIGTFNTSIKPFVSLVEENVVEEQDKKYIDFIDKYKAGEYHDNVSILISEWANRGDLLDFIRKNYRNFSAIHWKVFFFQIISVLAVIQSKFPTFRHNDLKANNILVHKINKENTKFTYRVARSNYRVTNVGYQIKLWDFDFACIPKVVENSKVSSEWTKAINVIPEQNRYYDMHYFFNTLVNKGFFPQFLTEACIPQEARDFVERIVPKKYKKGPHVHKRGRILSTDEYLTPDEVLKNDPYFSEFRDFDDKQQVKKSSKDKKLSKKKSIKKSIKKKTKKSSTGKRIKIEDLLADSD